MAEMKISIAAPELIAAINKLTEALAGTPAPIVEQPSAPQQDTTQAPAPQQAYIAPAPIVAQTPLSTARPTAVPDPTPVRSRPVLVYGARGSPSGV